MFFSVFKVLVQVVFISCLDRVFVAAVTNVSHTVHGRQRRLLLGGLHGS